MSSSLAASLDHVVQALPNNSLCHGSLATPRTPKSLPKILQEQTSFSHQCNDRESPNGPIRGKRHGAFVCTEIKPASGR
nr:PREDICTED: uncharacterized protein C2orf73 homolog [Struthio camelus australis]